MRQFRISFVFPRYYVSRADASIFSIPRHFQSFVHLTKSFGLQLRWTFLLKTIGLDEIVERSLFVRVSGKFVGIVYDSGGWETSVRFGRRCAGWVVAVFWGKNVDTSRFSASWKGSSIVRSRWQWRVVNSSSAAIAFLSFCALTPMKVVADEHHCLF